MPLSLKLLGEFTVRDETGTVLSLPTRKTRALLGYLAVNANRPQPRERLMALLWSDRGERQARQSLNQALLSIRRLRDGDGVALLDSDGEQVTLRGDAVDCDVQRLRSLIEDDPAAAAALYDGPFLDGLSVPDPGFEEWFLATRSELHALACDTLETAADTSNDTTTTLDCVRRLVALDPLREDAHRRLMQLLHKSGDRAGALRQYQTCAEVLQRELQVEPDAATTALFEEIRRAAGTEVESTTATARPDASPLPDKPSIAVLPIENITGDPTQEYLADGLVEDIITALSKFRWLFVIARNSSFTYKGRAVAVKQIAREMGVRYVLEGSVRKGGNRVRISAQLIDATNDRNLWANHFDGQVSDIFDLQDEITESIVGAIAPEIGQAEIARAKRRPPNSLDTWSLYQHGSALSPSGAEEDIQAAIKFFDQARQADPGFVDAIAMAAFMRTRLAYSFQPINYHDLLNDADQLLRLATRLDPRNFVCHMALGQLHYTLGEYDLAVAMAREAVTLNPNSATAHVHLGMALFGANRYEESLQHKDIALRLSPNDPRISSTLVARASALFMLGRYEECAESALRSANGPYPRYWADSYAVAALTKLGRKKEANLAKKRLLERKSDYSVSKIEKFYASAHPPKLVKLYCDALREAGLPD
jgi:TolB-like protein